MSFSPKPTHPLKNKCEECWNWLSYISFLIHSQMKGYIIILNIYVSKCLFSSSTKVLQSIDVGWQKVYSPSPWLLEFLSDIDRLISLLSNAKQRCRHGPPETLRPRRDKHTSSSGQNLRSNFYWFWGFLSNYLNAEKFQHQIDEGLVIQNFLYTELVFD
jgi:hypothetical protein